MLSGGGAFCLRYGLRGSATLVHHHRAHGLHPMLLPNPCAMRGHVVRTGRHLHPESGILPLGAQGRQKAGAASLAAPAPRALRHDAIDAIDEGLQKDGAALSPPQVAYATREEPQPSESERIGTASAKCLSDADKADSPRMVMKVFVVKWKYCIIVSSSPHLKRHLPRRIKNPDIRGFKPMTCEQFLGGLRRYAWKQRPSAREVNTGGA